MTVSVAAFDFLQHENPNSLAPETQPWIKWGQGTPDGDASPWKDAQKGSLWMAVNNTDDTSHVYMKVDEGSDDNDWVNLSMLTGDQTLTGALTVTNTVATAALGTVRSVIGQITASATGISGGNVVGVRGLCTLSGTNTAGGAYFYGAQGKLVVTGTMNHADSRLCSMLAQLDATGGTLTAGQLSGLWVDIVGITGAGGGQFNGIRITANAAAVPNALIYAQADASYAFEFIKPSGGNQTYVATAGTNSASAGAATGVAAKVLKVSIDGTAFYIPLFSGNT